MTRYWWVNQGESYYAGRESGSLWAPFDTGDTHQTRYYWQTMTELSAGDIVLHYDDGMVKAISVVGSPAIEAFRPYATSAGRRTEIGWLVFTVYRDGRPPVFLDEIPLESRLRESQRSPFNRHGLIKQGYLFPLTDAFALAFLDRFGERFGEVRSSGGTLPSSRGGPSGWSPS